VLATSKACIRRKALTFCQPLITLEAAKRTPAAVWPMFGDVVRTAGASEGVEILVRQVLGQVAAERAGDGSLRLGGRGGGRQSDGRFRRVGRFGRVGPDCARSPRAPAPCCPIRRRRVAKSLAALVCSSDSSEDDAVRIRLKRGT
jgi:hypothetical protein